MQYPVIYAVFSRLNRCNSLIRYRASLADSSLTEERRRRKRKSEDRRFARFGDLPVGTLAIPSSKVNSTDAHGSTR